MGWAHSRLGMHRNKQEAPFSLFGVQGYTILQNQWTLKATGAAGVATGEASKYEDVLPAGGVPLVGRW